MKKKRRIKVSVLIANYNNQKFVVESISSIKKQNFKNLEIIVIDVRSTDGSYKVLKKIKNIDLIQTKKKKKYSSYNQMNAYLTGYKKSKGEIICFLDSDDFFSNKKISYIYKFFKENPKIQMVSDKPIYFFNKKKKIRWNIIRRSKYLIPWQHFPPQSCISIRKKYLKKIIDKIMIFKFPNTWMDFRLVCQAAIDFDDIKVLDKYLTYYRQNPNSQIIEFKKKYSFNWWKKREEAHLFQKFLYIRNSKRLNYSLDRFLTKIINIFIN